MQTTKSMPPEHPAAQAVARRNNSFDLLRLAAALAVVVQHSVAHLDARFLWATPYTPYWFYDGVPAFFILSGYFVFRSAASFRARGASPGDFLHNRGLRIAPAIWAYFLVTFITLAVLGVFTLRDLASAQGAAWVITSLGLAPVFTPTFLRDFGVGSLNGSLCTIPVEVSFYALIALILAPV